MDNYLVSLFQNSPRPYIKITVYKANRSQQISLLKDYHDFGYPAFSLASLNGNGKSL